MVWQAGQSGNARGRPKKLFPTDDKYLVADIRDLAKKASPEAMNTLIAIMKNTKAPFSVRIAAATTVLDRGWGRPSQTIETNVNVFERMSDDELRKYVESATAAIGAGEGGLGPAAVQEGLREEPSHVH